jgi:hypothetical protein
MLKPETTTYTTLLIQWMLGKLAAMPECPLCSENLSSLSGRIHVTSGWTSVCLGDWWILHKKRVQIINCKQTLSFTVSSPSNQVKTSNDEESPNNTERKGITWIQGQNFIEFVREEAKVSLDYCLWKDRHFALSSQVLLFRLNEYCKQLTISWTQMERI